jgi:hypothetical protein
VLSSKIISDLVHHFKITDLNARKIVQRAAASKIIQSSAPITFGKGQFAYSSPGKYLGKEVIKELAKDTRPPLYRLLEVMDQGDGIISYYEALKITSSPLKGSSSKVNSLDELLSLLENSNIAGQTEDDQGVRYIYYTNKDQELSSLIQQQFTAMVLDATFLPDIIRWLKKSNIIDTVNVRYRNKKTPSIGAEHNNLLWDAFSYSKTTGIRPMDAGELNIEKQTLVVLDVILCRDYSKVDLDGFYSRVQLNLNSVKSGKRKIMPIIIYKSMSEFVFNSLKKLGFMCFNIGSIFGARIYEVIEGVRRVQSEVSTNNSENIEDHVDAILKVLRDSGQDSQLKDLKGTLFEFLMYPLLKTLYPNASIIASKVITSSTNHIKESYEYDYIIESSNPKEIIVIECKGYMDKARISKGNNETKNTLCWFFERTLPFAKTHYKASLGTGYKFKGCYVTTASFWREANDYLHELNKGKLKPLALNISYSGQELIGLLRRYEFHNIIGTIQKFYREEDKLEDSQEKS